MKANLNKYHLLLSITDGFRFKISETVIRNSNSKKLLGVTFDNKLKLEKHIITICPRANRKLNALARLTPYMELGKRRMLMNAFFNSQFNYRNIQALTIEMYKVANGMSPKIMNEIFQLREKSRYNLRYTSEFIIPPIHSVYNGSESVSYLKPKI